MASYDETLISMCDWTISIVMVNNDVYQMAGVRFYEIQETIMLITETAYAADETLEAWGSIKEMQIH